MRERAIEQWNRLRAEQREPGISDLPTLASSADSGYGPVRLALGAYGEPRVLVPVRDANHFPRLPIGAHLDLRLSHYTLGGRRQAFIDVKCLDRALDSVFAELADEIMARIRTGNAPDEAVAGTITDFRALLDEPVEEEVDPAVLLGLLGELVILKELSGRAVSAVDAWTGPFEQRHDFRRNINALEVKTSGRADATTVTVSSIEQLLEPAGGSLLLAHVRMERAAGGSISMHRLVSDLFAIGVSRERLLSALREFKCADPAAPEWNRAQYALEGITWYRVSTGFPRLTSAEMLGGGLPEGVFRLKYSVDLRVADPFRIDGSALEAAISRVAA